MHRYISILLYRHIYKVRQQTINDKLMNAKKYIIIRIKVKVQKMLQNATQKFEYLRSNWVQ